MPRSNSFCCSIRTVMLIVLTAQFSTLIWAQENDSLTHFLNCAEEHYRSNHEIAFDCAKNGLKKSISLDQNIATSRFHYLIGAMYLSDGEIDSAQFHLQNFISTDSTFHWYDLHAKTLGWLTYIDMVKDDWKKALEHSSKGHELAVYLNDTVQMIEHLNYLGEIYRNINPIDWRRALDYQLEALEYAQAINAPSQIMYTSNFIGAIYDYARQSELAIEAYKRTIYYAELVADSFAAGQAYHNIALIYKDKPDSLIRYDQLALSYFQSNDPIMPHEEFQIICHCELLEAYQRKGKTDEAKLHLKKCIDGELPNPEYQTEKLKTLSSYYHFIGNDLRAYEMLKESEEIKGAIFNEETMDFSLELFSWYESEKKSREITLLKLKETEIALKNQKLNQKNEQLQFRRNLYLTIGIAAILLLILTFRYFRQRGKALALQNDMIDLKLQQEQKEGELLKEHIREKNQSLISYSLLIAQKNETLQQILADQPNTDLVEYKMRIKSIVNNSVVFEKEWDEFMKLFQETYSGYFKRLLEINQKITQKDLRLCALLKIGLTSKQIAQTLFIAPGSVDISRSRLKKKLGLEKEENLSVFLRGLG